MPPARPEESVMFEVAGVPEEGPGRESRGSGGQGLQEAQAGLTQAAGKGQRPRNGKGAARFVL